jgi:hypothetical protein
MIDASPVGLSKFCGIFGCMYDADYNLSAICSALADRPVGPDNRQLPSAAIDQFLEFA